MFPFNSINTLRNSSAEHIPCSTGCGWLWGQRAGMAICRLPEHKRTAPIQLSWALPSKQWEMSAVPSSVACQDIPHCGFILYCLVLRWTHLGKWLLLYWNATPAAGTRLRKLHFSLCLGQLEVPIKSPAHDARFHSCYQQPSRRHLGKLNPGWGRTHRS